MLAACTNTVDGTAERHGAVDAVRDLGSILPTAAEVSQAAGNPLADNGPPVIGRIDVLPNGIRDDSVAHPIACLGPVSPFMRVVYEIGEVRGAALQQFSNYGDDQTVSSVDVGVVEFASEAEAQRVFTTFVAQWQGCEGTTVTTQLPEPANTTLHQRITGVTPDGPMLSATVVNSDSQGDAEFPTERAVGIAADCIVDLDVAVTHGASTQGSDSRRAMDLLTDVLAKVTRRR